MNRRIKELAIQAQLLSDNSYTIETIEHFAKLIISDCVQHCNAIAAISEITNSGETARKTKATAESCAALITSAFAD